MEPVVRDTLNWSALLVSAGLQVCGRGGSNKSNS